MKCKCKLTALLLLGACNFGNAQQSSLPVAAISAPSEFNDHGFVTHVLGNTAVFENIMIYCFGLVVVGLQYKLLRKANASPEEILRTFTITLIIILSLTVLNGGSEKAEFTPIIGLFGTIIGYMLGANRAGQRRQSGEQADRNDEDRKS